MTASATQFASLGDFRVGERRTSEEYRISREELIAFARRYDPQEYHLQDDAAARNPLFDRISASGMHSGAIATRLLAGHLRDAGQLPLFDIAVDGLRWVRPLYPDDVVHLEMTTVSAAPSREQPDLGVVELDLVLRNQHGETLLTARRALAVTLP